MPQQHTVDVANKLVISGVNIRGVRHDMSQPRPLRHLCRWVTAFLDAFECEVAAEDEEMRFLVEGSRVDEALEDAKSPDPHSHRGFGGSSRTRGLTSPMEGDYETKQNR